MGNILIDNNGNALLSGNKALEVTASIDSNIVAGNIKKDVTILGVTGTYEGSGGSNIISFTVSGGGSVTKTYQAEKDMTWQEWINSTYYNSSYNFSIENTGNVKRGMIDVESSTNYTYASSIKEYGHNVIKNNRVYTQSGGSND